MSVSDHVWKRALEELSAARSELTALAGSHAELEHERDRLREENQGLHAICRKQERSIEQMAGELSTCKPGVQVAPGCAAGRAQVAQEVQERSIPKRGSLRQKLESILPGETIVYPHPDPLRQIKGFQSLVSRGVFPRGCYRPRVAHLIVGTEYFRAVAFTRSAEATVEANPTVKGGFEKSPR